MRKLLTLLAGSALALAVSGAADAALLDFSGTIKVTMGTMKTMRSVGTGVATLNSNSGLGHLKTLQVAGGISNMTLTTQFATDPNSPTITKVIGSFGNGTGTLGAISGGVLSPNTFPLTGFYKVCILLAGCGNYFTVPMQSGAAGVGIGGWITANGFGPGFRMSVQAAPWTLATAVLTNVTTINEMVPASSRVSNGTTKQKGFAYGPLTLNSSTASTGGVIQVVTPTLIITNLMVPNRRIGLPISMTLEFTPEPGVLLLLASGVGGLALLGRGRLRR